MSFWQNKSVLVTGADGFLGSNVVKSLLAHEAAVVTLSRNGIRPTSLLALEGFVAQIAGQERGSVEDLDGLLSIISRHRIDIIYHLAALPLVEIGHASPIQTFETNIRGSWNVLEAARLKKIKKIVLASTAHVYGDNLNLPYSEALYPQPSRPYETSKACADLLAQCYADTYSLEVEIPRLVNLYGPGDFNFSRIVPKIIKTILSGENPKIWRSEAVRDFLFIDDAVAGLLALGENDFKGQKRNRIFNLGSGRPVPIMELVTKIVDVSLEPGITLEIEPRPEDRSKEIERQYVAIGKAKKELAWRPRVSLEQGLRQTFAWYRKYKEHFLVKKHE